MRILILLTPLGYAKYVMESFDSSSVLVRNSSHIMLTPLGFAKYVMESFDSSVSLRNSSRALRLC
jgi:hypothetical protein